jgi:DNA-binding response OmpR family regulator
MKILAVDDNPFILDFLPAVLRQANFTDISVAPSGREALDILAATDRPFDCLLLDIVMPDMDGITLCREIRKLAAYRNTPIIMLTLNTDAVSIEQAFVAGANDYITKPFSVKDIVGRLRVAKRMWEKTDVAPRLNPYDMQSENQPGLHKFALRSPAFIEGVKQIVQPFSLGNYVSQLSRNHLDSCHIFAVRVEDIQNIYIHATSREFAQVMAAVARSVSRVVNCPELLMTHYGNGTLLCVLNGDNVPDWPEIEDLVQDEVDSLSLTYEDGREMPVAVTVGMPVHPNASRNQRVKMTFERAIKRAATREKAKFDTYASESMAV